MTWELECLFNGFCQTLTKYVAHATKLSTEDCEYLRKKIGRIESAINILPQSIKCVKDLPVDYAGIHGPEVLVSPGRRAS